MRHEPTTNKTQTILVSTTTPLLPFPPNPKTARPFEAVSLFHKTSHITRITITIAPILEILKDLERVIGGGQKARYNTYGHTVFVYLNNFFFLTTAKENVVWENIKIIITANTYKIPILLEFYLSFGLLEFKKSLLLLLSFIVYYE